jgi:GH15 family glucan-1,4-alpha-glucosidase
MAPSVDIATRAVSPHVLREYALLADGERGALVGPAGDIGWFCAPYWDSPSVFSSLIGGTGCYVITPDGRYVWGGYYEEGTLIWHSRWVTESGRVESREALAYPADSHRTVLLRQVRPEQQRCRMLVRLCPRADYDAAPMRDLHRRRGVWTARVGKLWLRWSGAEDARPRENGRSLALAMEIEPDQRRDLVLEISDEPLPDDVPDPKQLWEATEKAWDRAVPQLPRSLDPRLTRHSYAVLRGLTSRQGGMVAAATTSLPERAEEGRNYDYRYVWIRDQCFAGRAVATIGPLPLLDEAVSFVSDRLLEHGASMAPAYTTRAEPVPEQRHLDLPGYPGGYDIVGNWVRKQFQLDAFGESLLLFAAAARHDRLDTRHWDAAQVAAEAIARRWQEPDAGIWEIEARNWTHSRLICAAGLKAMAGVRPESATARDWLALADRIVATTAAEAVHPDGHWQRAPDDEKLDASLLLAGLRCAVPPEDPRTRATLRAYLRELAEDGYAFRYRIDDRALSDAEGSFLLCGFLVALALQQQGDVVEARAWYERTKAACGPPVLYSEEFDPHQHQMRGNVPQAFVHALQIEAAAVLYRDREDHL